MLWSRAAVLPSWFPPALPTCFSCGAAFRQQPQLQTIGETFPIRFPRCKALIISQNPTRTHLSPGCMAEAAARLHGYRANREPDSRALLPATICFLWDSLPLFLGSSCLPASEGRWVVRRIPQAVVLCGAFFSILRKEGCWGSWLGRPRRAEAVQWGLCGDKGNWEGGVKVGEGKLHLSHAQLRAGRGEAGH